MIKENDNNEKLALEPERVLGAKLIRELRETELKMVNAAGVTGGKNKEPSQGTLKTYFPVAGPSGTVYKECDRQ